MNVKRLVNVINSYSDPAERIQIGFPFGKSIHNSVYVSMHASLCCVCLLITDNIHTYYSKTTGIVR